MRNILEKRAIVWEEGCGQEPWPRYVIMPERPAPACEGYLPTRHLSNDLLQIEDDGSLPAAILTTYGQMVIGGGLDPGFYGMLLEVQFFPDQAGLESGGSYLPNLYFSS
jgi:hypothetical protein